MPYHSVIIGLPGATMTIIKYRKADGVTYKIVSDVMSSIEIKDSIAVYNIFNSELLRIRFISFYKLMYEDDTVDKIAEETKTFFMGQTPSHKNLITLVAAMFNDFVENW